MTAPSTQTTQSKSRRALLAGALGGIGAWAASAIGRTSPTLGANGDPIVIGSNNSASARTRLTSSAPNDAAFWADAGTGTIAYGVVGTASSGYGVYGTASSGTGTRGVSTSGYGVNGTSSSSVGVNGSSSSASQPAVRGVSAGGSTAVLGSSGEPPPDAKPKTGVYGYANQDSSSKGVYGQSGKGVGLFGQAGKFGIALRAKGRIKADQVSGVATIAAGSTGVTVTPGVNVTNGSFVLLTPKANIGSRSLWFTTNPSADTIRIHLSASRSSATKIAWLMLG